MIEILASSGSVRGFHADSMNKNEKILHEYVLF